jgi:lipoprotein-anchoring transpeptidase ErfK/SrfK
LKKAFLIFISGIILFTLFAASADARRAQTKNRAPVTPPIVVVEIRIASQSMSVWVNGWPYGFWKVSTGREGYGTPRGSFTVKRTAEVYYSKKYDNAPMPNSVFFYGGFAIHGTEHVSALGTPASHGCVRLLPEHAADLYDLVLEYGPSRTRVVLMD